MENKEETLTYCGFAAKTLKHKNNVASYAGSRDFQSAELSFLHPNVSVNDFYFQVKSHEHFFLIAVAYTSFPRFHQRTKNVENNRLHTPPL